MRTFLKYGFILFISTFFIQCQKEDALDSTVYSTFETKISVNHNSPELPLTDTLWVTSNISGYLVDSATQEHVFFSEALIVQSIVVRSWDSVNQVNQRDNYSFIFETDCDQLTQTNKASMVRLRYEKTNNVYHFKVGILFKKPGIYCIDADKISIKTSDHSKYYGGGIVFYNDMNNAYHEGYVSASLENLVTNFELYQELSAEAKSAFQVVDETNKQKYYFVKVLDSIALN